MRKLITIAAILIAVAQGSETHGQLSRKSDARPVSPLDFHGQMSAIHTPRTSIARDQRTFEALWKQANPGSRAPKVDFKSFDVAAAFAGERRTGGYSVQFVGVRRAGRVASAHFTIESPSPNMMVTQALTQPWAMRLVPKSPAVTRVEVKTSVRGPR